MIYVGDESVKTITTIIPTKPNWLRAVCKSGKPRVRNIRNRGKNG